LFLMSKMWNKIVFSVILQMMLFVFSKAKLQKIMSASLAVWLSGFVLLFCCGTMEAQSAEAEFCPLAKAESHCKKINADENQTSFSGKSDLVFDCCNFLPAVFDKVRKIEKTKRIAQIADKIKIESPPFLPVKNNSERAENCHKSSFYQEKIFIKNCVFRI
jgi:hypothetical protein